MPTFTISPIGQKMLLGYEIIGPAIAGELDSDGQIIENPFGHLFWAAPIYRRLDSKERVLVCLSGMTNNSFKQSTELTEEYLKNKGCFS